MSALDTWRCMVQRCCLFAALAHMLVLPAKAQFESNFIGRECSVLEGSWGSEPSLADLEGAARERSLTGVVNLGNDGAWHWVRVELLSSAFGGKHLELATAQLDSVVVMTACNGVVHHREEAIGGSGSNVLMDGTYPSFPITEELCEELLMYVGVKSGKQLMLPMRVAPKSQLRQWSSRRNVFYAFYAGIMLVMLLYNLVLYFTVEDRSYLLYVLFLIGVAASQLFLAGYQWVLPGWQGSSWFGMRSVHVVGMFSGVTTILFVNRFLDLARKGPTYFKLFNGFMSLYLVAGAFLVAGKLNWAYQVINMVALAALLVVPASIHVRRQGQRSALFLLIAFSFFLLTVVLFAFSQSFGHLTGGLLEQPWIHFAMPVGSIVEVVLLSIALADRINQLKKESAQDREEKLRISELNEQITKQQNEVLERNVLERTEELEERNERLRAALDELKMAQDQLVQSEKLASIGQLTAGIAHELNNPINFVSSSAQSLRRDFEDVLSVLEAFKELASEGTNVDEAVRALAQRMEHMDLAFTLKEIDELLNGIDDGTARTSEIVKGLRIFSRMDGDASKDANVNDLLESTLVILRSSLKDEVQLQVDLAPNLPEISCQPGKLNQVLMNLITNAAQATVKAGMPAEDRHVRVRTRQAVVEGATCVQVAVEDNGIGMTEDVKSQIFNPFFTTKEVGEGTGLGLSIVKGILDDHNATLEIQTAPGEGTIFLITFPS